MVWIRFLVKSVFSTLWYSFATLIIVAAVAISTFRLTAPLANTYTNSIETWVQQALGRPVHISEINAYWRGLQPHILLNKLQVLNDDRDKTLIAFDQAEISIDLLNSLRHLTLLPGSLSIDGINLNIETDRHGQTRITGLQSQPFTRDSQSNENLAQWVFGQSQLHLRKGNIYWSDLQHQVRYQFSGVQMTLLNAGERHVLRGLAELPANLGRSVRFAADLRGPGNHPRRWHGKTFLRCSECRFKALNHYVPDRTWQWQGGRADLEMWAGWNNGQLRKLEGYARLHKPRLLGRDKAELEKISGRFAWRGAPDQWQLLVEDVHINLNGESWPTTRLVVQNQGEFIHITTGFVRLQELSDTLALFPATPIALKTFLQQLDLHGDVHGMQWVAQISRPENFFLHADVLDLSIKSWRYLPALHGVDGSIKLTRDAGIVNINSHDASIDWPYMFRHRLHFDAIAGKAAWRKSGRHWIAASRQIHAVHGDLDLYGRIALRKPRGPFTQQGSFIDLGVNAGRGSLDGIRQYLSLKAIPRYVGDKINAIAHKATIEGGGVLFQGHIKKYPFLQGDGKFLVQTDLHDASVVYAAPWPKLTNVQAHFTFDGRTARLSHGAGKIYRSAFHQSNVVIDGLRAKTPRLQVNGHIRAGTDDAVTFLVQSPLKQRFEPYLQGADAGGKSDISLQLSMPLHGIPAVNVQGQVQLRNSRIDMHAVGVKLDKINGTLHFTNEKLRAKSIRANIWNMPAKLDVHTEKSAKNTYTVISGKGDVDVAKLRARFDLPALRYANGASTWQGVMRIRQASLEVFPQLKLQLQSHLQGIAIDLPEPVGKTADQAQKFFLEHFVRSTNGNTLHLHYEGGNLRAVFYGENRSGRGLMFQRGELRFGGEPAVLPTEKGLRVGGFIAKLSASEWDRMLFANNQGETHQIANTSIATLVNRIDVSVQNGEAMGYRFNDVHLNATKTADRWQAQVTSADAEGMVRLPVDFNRDTLEINMKRLYLNPIESHRPAKTDPRYLPAVQATITDLKYAGAKLGSVTCRIAKYPPGLEIQTMEIDSPILSVNVKGRWFVIDGKTTTKAYAAMDADNAGRLLENFGFVNSLSGGKSKLVFDLQWPGQP